MSESTHEQAGDFQATCTTSTAGLRSEARAVQVPRRKRTTAKRPSSLQPPSSKTPKLDRKLAWCFPKSLSEWTCLAGRAWTWLRTQRSWERRSKRMTLCETVSLGEKRFLAIVKVDGDQFLVGGAVGRVSLLTQLSTAAGFEMTLRRRHRPEE